MEWKIIERPGYLGKKRDEVEANWNSKFGKGNWRISYDIKGIIIPKEMGIQIYEDAYYRYLENNPEILDWLITSASDVYDTAQTNVLSGLDYSKQETPNNHIQDISIRQL
jgi:hypothetical protein